MHQSLYHTALLVILGHCAWTDYTSLKIRNHDTLALLAVVGVCWVMGVRSVALDDVIIASGVFGFAFVFWLIGWIGAGDAKLLGAVVLALGANLAMAFAHGLLACAVFCLFTLKMLPVLDLYCPLPHRLRDLLAERRIPYGICIALAAGAAIAGRHLDLL